MILQAATLHKPSKRSIEITSDNHNSQHEANSKLSNHNNHVKVPEIVDLELESFDQAEPTANQGIHVQQ